MEAEQAQGKACKVGQGTKSRLARAVSGGREVGQTWLTKHGKVDMQAGQVAHVMAGSSGVHGQGQGRRQHGQSLAVWIV